MTSHVRVVLLWLCRLHVSSEAWMMAECESVVLVPFFSTG